MEPSVKKKFANTNTYNTCYLEAGAGEPLLLIHGGGAGADSWGNWSGCFGRLAKARRVIAMDMVGFGDSDKPDPEQFEYSQQARVDQVIAFLDALDIERASIVGNSMGGITGLGVAIQHPERVENLVLMGASGLSKGLSEALKPIVGYDYTLEGMKKIMSVLSNPDFQASDEMLRYRHQRSIDPVTRKAYDAISSWVKRNGGVYYDEADIASVKARTLLLGGKDDGVCPVDEAVRALKLIDNAFIHIVPHCRHWVMVEYPDHFCRVVEMFLEKGEI